MKVLIVHPHMAVYGGAETVVIKLSQNLTEKGVETAILTLSVSPALLDVCKDLRLIKPAKNFPYTLKSTSFLHATGLINEIFGLRTLVRKNAHLFDVINFHNFPATWSLFPINKPSVWMCNEPPDLWTNPNPSVPLRLLRNCGRQVDKWIVNKYVTSICVADKFNAERVSDRYGRQSSIIPYGIDCDFVSRGNGKKMVDKFCLEDKFVLLQVGWFTPQKNQLESIEVVKKLKNDIPNIKLILVGSDDSSYARMIKSYIHRNNLEDQILLTGHLSKECVRDLYHACNVLVHPIKEQGGWLTPFEALCASKPIIVSRKMSASDIIEREKIGVVTDNFVEAVLNIHNNPEKYLNMAIKGKQFVVDKLSWEKFCKRMLKVFENVNNLNIVGIHA